MPIQVTCPSCLKKFQVSEKFAGQTGPCPSCKEPIKIPTLEDQVVIHAPDDGSPKDASGRPVLKTERASDSKFSVVIAGIVGAVVLALIVGAYVIGASTEPESISVAVLGGGALLLGPLVAWAGYTFLRDQELEPHAGTALGLRCLGCGVGFAAGWLAFWVLAVQITGASDWTIGELNTLQLLFAVGVAVGIAAFAAFVALDLDPTNAVIHAAMYFGVAVLLRLLMGLTSLPGLASG